MINRNEPDHITENIKCVDACLAVKWVAASEDYSQLARHFLAQWQQKQVILIAPPAFDSEIRTALRKKVVDTSLPSNQRLSENEYIAGLNLVRSLVDIRTDPSLDYVAMAFHRYLRAKDSKDTLYIALAALNGCELWTADETWVDTETKKALSGTFHFIKQLKEQDTPSEYMSPAFTQHQEDAVITKQLKADLWVTKFLYPKHPQKIPNAMFIIPGVSGDGSNGTPDYIDREHTTAHIDTENGTIG